MENNKITFRQAQLIKRMAWSNIKRLEKKSDTPTEEEKRLSLRAVRMLTFVACLNYAMIDLETDLKMAGKLQNPKQRRYFYMAKRIAGDAHQTAYKMLVSVHTNVGYEYNKALDVAWAMIDDAVLLQGVERSYGIVCALCRLIGSLNKELGHRYYFAPAEPIARIPYIMDVQGIEDREIDRIIDLNVE